MATVVKEFVNGATVNERGGSLLGTDEIYCKQHKEASEDCPGKKLAKGNDRDRDWLIDRTGSRLGHDETSWDRASQIKYEMSTKEGLAFDDQSSITVAPPRRSFTGFFISSSTSDSSVDACGGSVKDRLQVNGSLELGRLWNSIPHQLDLH
jgi:hypothetical protein